MVRKSHPPWFFLGTCSFQ